METHTLPEPLGWWRGIVHICAAEFLALNEGALPALFGGKGMKETKHLTELLDHLAGGGGLGGP